MALSVWVGPYRPDEVTQAVLEGGGTLTTSDLADALVWYSLGPDIGEARQLLTERVRWVQLDSAGADRWFDAGLVDDRRAWSCARGIYGAAVAEHVVMLILAGLRRLKALVLAREWRPLAGEALSGKVVGVVGAGIIGREVLGRLSAFHVHTLALTRRGGPVAGADEWFAPSELEILLDRSDIVVLSAPLTPSTRGFIGRRQLDLIGPRGWLVNVGRGALVDTDELLSALKERRLGGACLDVVEPEPLETDHELWHLPNAIVTPRVSNKLLSADGSDYRLSAYASLVRENVGRFVRGEDLLGRLSPTLGY